MIDRPEYINHETIVDSNFIDSLLDAIDAEFDEHLSRHGGAMSGIILFVSGQTFDGIQVEINDPLYTHTGVYQNLLDHINDDIVHQTLDNTVQLQGGAPTPQEGNISIDGNIECTNLHCDNLYGNVSNATGLPLPGSANPNRITHLTNPGISSQYSRHDHKHKGVGAIIPGVGMSCYSDLVEYGKYYGDVEVSADLSGIYVSGLQVYGDLSGAAIVLGIQGLEDNPLQYLPQEDDPSSLVSDHTYGLRWSKRTTPLVDVYIDTPVVSGVITGLHFINDMIQLDKMVITRNVSGVDGVFEAEIRLREDDSLVIAGAISHDSFTEFEVFTDFEQSALTEEDMLYINVTDIETEGSGYRIQLF